MSYKERYTHQIMGKLESMGIDPSDKESSLACLEQTVMPERNKKFYLDNIYQPDAIEKWELMQNGKHTGIRFTHKPSAECNAKIRNEIVIAGQYRDNPGAWHQDPEAERWTVQPIR